MPFYRLTQEVRAPKSPAGALFPGVIAEHVARTLLGEDFSLAVERGHLELEIDPLPHNGWPTARHAEGSPDHARPITPGAKFLVRCACGYAADSSCETAEHAIASVKSAHDPSHTRYRAKAYPA